MWTIDSFTLKHTDLTDIVLNSADLTGANLEHANLGQANLAVACLADTRSSHANLESANLPVFWIWKNQFFSRTGLDPEDVDGAADGDTHPAESVAGRSRFRASIPWHTRAMKVTAIGA